MRISRKFTTAGTDPFASVKWVRRSSKITNPDGSVVFEMNDAEVPETWSQLATDIMVSKYFRRAGVPQADGTSGSETSARQVIHRLAGCWRHWGQEHGYFDTPEDGQAFYDELAFMMVHQMAAPNSPQWFNTGLNWAYGITGPAQGHYVPDPKTGEVSEADDAYTHPQPHACFIQSVSDDLVNEGGIMDLWVREARLFKYGSGTGTNFSNLRAENERLSGGGKSSGLMSWLKIGDRAAGAIKSGGTTRRAAKMVCLDMDHPDIETFVNWKVREELKVAAMVEGMKHLSKDQQETARQLGLRLDYDFNGEAYQTVSGQNSNNSVRIPDRFFDAVDRDGDWATSFRTSGKPARTFKARQLWDEIGYAAWRCADPGVQFDSTINAWHTCPGAGPIKASNPCSEYMFLDNTACNLASINLLKFYDAKRRHFDVERYEHAVDVWTVVLEISVLMAAYPSEEIARLSYRYRTLGLGYANFGAMAMQAGLAYDSDEARALCACLTAILTGRSYRQSAVMAAQLGPFAAFGDERASMLRVIRNHRRAAMGLPRESTEWEALRIKPVPIDHGLVRSGRANVANAGAISERAVRCWDEALALGEKHGYRNAQVTVIAPTGTIGLLMDCDTTGIEPDFALVKFKKLAGGGYFKIANASVRPALEALGYGAEQIREMLTCLLGTLNADVPMPDSDGKIPGAPESFRDFLAARGMTAQDIAVLNDALPGVFELRFAFNAWTLGEECVRRLGFNPDLVKSAPTFNMLRELGLSQRQIARLNEMICGTQTIEGAPHLEDAHLSVFDCANKCGRTGRRFIHPHGHIRAMAAAQPFISGAISKTINLPNDASVEDIKAAYRLSWDLGLKANALYRDGCKLSQPLNSQSDEEQEEAPEPGKAPASSAAPPAAPAATVLTEVAESMRGAGAAAVAPAGGRMSAVFASLEAKPAESTVRKPMRRRLPDTRASITHKFNIGGHEGYLTVGLYEDGQPGELFITMAKEGSTIGGLMDSLGTAVSVALQYGVPVESLVNKFTHQRFEPAGMTTNRDIPFAKSLVDYIFRWMGMEFIPGYREANAPHRAAPEGEAPDFGAAGAARGAGSAEQVQEEPSAWKDSGSGGGSAERAARASDSVDQQQRRADKEATPVGRGPSASPDRRAAPARGAASPVAAGRLTGGSGGCGGPEAARASETSSLSMSMQNNMGDAPACDVCGSITVRNGTCYKCLNCGNSMGCS